MKKKNKKKPTGRRPRGAPKRAARGDHAVPERAARAGHAAPKRPSREGRHGPLRVGTDDSIDKVAPWNEWKRLPLRASAATDDQPLTFAVEGPDTRQNKR